GIAGVVCLTLGCSQPGGSNSALAPAPATPPPSDDPRSTTSGFWRYTVVHLERQPSLLYGQFGAPRAAAGIWQIVPVRLSTRSQQTQPIQLTALVLRDGTGTVYAIEPPATANYSNLQRLAQPGSTVPPGDAVTAGLVFDVDPTAGGLELVPTGGGRPV